MDSWYDSYLGVVILVRVIDGKLKKGMKIKLMSNNQEHLIERVGVFTPKPDEIDDLNSACFFSDVSAMEHEFLQPRIFKT